MSSEQGAREVPTGVVDKPSILDDAVQLRKVYKETFPGVRAYVSSNSGTEDDAKDIFQEAMMSAWTNDRKGRYRPMDGSGISAYIFTIAKRKWLDRLRSSAHRNTMRLVETVVVAPEPEEEDEEERMKEMDRLFSKLGEKCRLLLTKFYFEKKKMRLIAEEMHHDEGSIRTMKYRCMSKLRDMATRG